eukprot:TRINITY_DN1819_c2_g1_i1.p1 TRINITY_DN1819_c2_g1~~TRINITY_DN1819_c2_g1_i1.p1  ORF type:complete len:703 (-),score=186.45 TRINITY_DN1819_c2_g1_i1:826-2934(-)
METDKNEVLRDHLSQSAPEPHQPLSARSLMTLSSGNVVGLHVSGDSVRVRRNDAEPGGNVQCGSEADLGPSRNRRKKREAKGCVVKPEPFTIVVHAKATKDFNNCEPDEIPFVAGDKLGISLVDKSGWALATTLPPPPSPPPPPPPSLLSADTTAPSTTTATTTTTTTTTTDNNSNNININNNNINNTTTTDTDSPAMMKLSNGPGVGWVPLVYLAEPQFIPAETEQARSLQMKANKVLLRLFPHMATASSPITTREHQQQQQQPQLASPRGYPLPPFHNSNSTPQQVIVSPRTSRTMPRVQSPRDMLLLSSSVLNKSSSDIPLAVAGGDPSFASDNVGNLIVPRNGGGQATNEKKHRRLSGWIKDAFVPKDKVKHDSLFGKELIDVLRYESIGGAGGVGDGLIPSIVTRTVQYLDAVGLDEQGIFRINGSQLQIQELKVKYTYEREPLVLEGQFVHTVAGLLKAFLRELPTPLFPPDTHQPLSDALEHENIQQRNEALTRVITTRVPKENRDLLAFMFAFLKRVSMHSEKNLMRSSTLGTIFAAIFMPSLMTSVADCRLHIASTTLITLLIEHGSLDVSNMLIRPQELVTAREEMLVVGEDAENSEHASQSQHTTTTGSPSTQQQQQTTTKVLSSRSRSVQYCAKDLHEQLMLAVQAHDDHNHPYRSPPQNKPIQRTQHTTHNIQHSTQHTLHTTHGISIW